MEMNRRTFLRGIAACAVGVVLPSTPNPVFQSPLSQMYRVFSSDRLILLTAQRAAYKKL